MTDDPSFHGRIEGGLKITGAAVFAADTAMPDLLHAALVEVSIAHGEVLGVEVGAVLSVQPQLGLPVSVVAEHRKRP